MRRQLMKKMRKGSLTPSERAELRELDREVNRANRQAAGIGGAGLAAALAIASKTGALDNLLDSRKQKSSDSTESKKESEEADVSGEAKTQEKESKRGKSERKEKKELKELRKAAEKEKLENERLDKKLKKHGGFDPRTGEYVDSDEQKAEDERFDKEFDEFLDKDLEESKIAEEIENLRESGMSDREIFEKLKKEGRLPGSVTGDNYVDLRYSPDEYNDDVARSDRRTFDDPFAASSPMAMMRQIRKNERIDKRDKKKEEKKEDRIQKQVDFANKYGGFNPITGEYIDSPEQIAADEKFDREFDEFFSDADAMEAARLYNEGRLEEAERLASQVMNPDESAMRRFRNRGAVGALRGGRAARDRTLPIDLLPFDSTTSDYTGGFETTGNRREFSSEDLSRRDGPRVNNVKGGYTPFLRSMRDRIRRRIR